jgi:hypothetical protein
MEEMTHENERHLVLEPETIRLLWSRTYNTEGKPDWSHLYPYYHDQIVFQDSIQKIEGKERFVALCERLTKRCKQLNMDLYAVIRVGDQAFIEWKMTMMFRVFPSTPIYGCTRLTIDGDEMITNQRDYYDLWGDIYNGIPWYRGLYRAFMRRFFG